MNHLLKLAAATALALSASTATFAADIALDHPWSRATPEGAKVGAGFVTIRNVGAAPDRLVSATSDVTDHVEVHEMAVADGIMKMRQVKAIEIPAGKAVELKPGGFHIMLMNLKKPLKAGDVVKGALMFEKAGALPVEFKVEAMGASASPHKH